MARASRPSSLLDIRVIYCGDCLDLTHIDLPFNSSRNYEGFWGETQEKRAFEDRHASTQAYIDHMRPRCVELARVRTRAWPRRLQCWCSKSNVREG